MTRPGQECLLRSWTSCSASLHCYLEFSGCPMRKSPRPRDPLRGLEKGYVELRWRRPPSWRSRLVSARPSLFSPSRKAGCHWRKLRRFLIYCCFIFWSCPFPRQPPRESLKRHSPPDLLASDLNLELACLLPVCCLSAQPCAIGLFCFCICHFASSSKSKLFVWRLAHPIRRPGQRWDRPG